LRVDQAADQPHGVHVGQGAGQQDGLAAAGGALRLLQGRFAGVGFGELKAPARATSQQLDDPLPVGQAAAGEDDLENVARRHAGRLRKVPSVRVGERMSIGRIKK
jgi:hypothetical protein